MDAGKTASGRVQSLWGVWDMAERDPWGVRGPAFGPMSEADAKAMVARGAAQKVPRRYRAAPMTPAREPS